MRTRSRRKMAATEETAVNDSETRRNEPFCSCSYCDQCQCIAAKTCPNKSVTSKSIGYFHNREDKTELLLNGISFIIEIGQSLVVGIKRIVFFPVLFFPYWFSLPLIYYIISLNYYQYNQPSIVDIIQQLVVFVTNKISSSIYVYDDLSRHLIKAKGIKCDYNLEIYFVRVRSQVFELEVSWKQINKSVEIKRCSLMVDEKSTTYEPIRQVIISLEKYSSIFLDYYCSKLNVEDEKTSATLKSTKIDMVSEIVIDYLNDDRDDLDQDELHCLNELKSCTPSVRRKSKKLNLNNQLDFDLKHCFCVKKFYTCLKSLPFSSQIGLFYFNYLKLKCFNYEFTNSCRLYLLGSCILYGDFECRIRLVQQNPLF